MKAFSIPPHPPALSITKTCIYKTIGRVTIPIDIYVLTDRDVGPPPIMLFIHGKLIPYCYSGFYMRAQDSGASQEVECAFIFGAGVLSS